MIHRGVWREDGQLGGVRGEEWTMGVVMFGLYLSIERGKCMRLKKIDSMGEHGKGEG